MTDTTDINVAGSGNDFTGYVATVPHNKYSTWFWRNAAGRLHDRHARGANFTYCDYHVRWFREPPDAELFRCNPNVN